MRTNLMALYKQSTKKSKQKPVPLRKVCSKCKQLKHYKLFYRNRSKATGLCDYCKDCDRARQTVAARRRWHTVNRDVFIYQIREMFNGH